MNESYIIRRLHPQDCKIWKDFRLEALQNSPENFGSSYEEESTWTDEVIQERLTRSDIFGLFINNILISAGGFYRLLSLKTQHRGVIWGMYTKPKYRGQGFAGHILQALINHAKQYVDQSHLTCVSSNLPAVELYKRNGFQIYGQEPNALKINHQYFDEYLMVLKLK